MASFHIPDSLRPPTLLTTFAPSRGPSALQTPLTASSLSSPFQSASQYHHSYLPTPTSAATGRSEWPMNGRVPHNLTYNPGEWTPGARVFAPTERQLQDQAAQRAESEFMSNLHSRGISSGLC